MTIYPDTEQTESSIFRVYLPEQYFLGSAYIFGVQTLVLVVGTHKYSPQCIAHYWVDAENNWSAGDVCKRNDDVKYIINYHDALNIIEGYPSDEDYD